MQGYAYGFLIAGLASACFIDSGVKDSIARLGKMSVALFAVLFVVAETMALMA